MSYAFTWNINPRPVETFSITRLQKGVATPPWIFYIKRLIPLCLLPMYSYHRSPLANDTKKVPSIFV